ncbi:hypothetical protein NUW54_g7803 [Trametes sanguinea]|uniref:Uncharacterized protein n=1 Tax=Trametes sanguinea TaxID=158606 RepID=A0ACC1PJ53_9APHY|nr:hypothetical protein NUW54_g7803 [Trametes sanguinea]
MRSSDDDSDEERGGKPSKGKQKESTPDPLDCIDDREPSTFKRNSPQPPHDFERTSDDEKQSRLPPDGPSTIRLQQQQQARRDVVDIDLVSDDDEIESASGFDQEDGLPRKEED